MSDKHHQRTRLRYCTDCKRPLDSATEAGEGVAESTGQISICFYCGHCGIFESDGSVRRITLDEWSALDAETQQQVMDAQDAIRRANQDRLAKQLQEGPKKAALN